MQIHGANHQVSVSKIWLVFLLVLSLMSISYILISPSSVGASENGLLQSRIDELMRSRGITRQDAEKRLMWEDKASVIDTRMAKTYAETYGGTWIDENSDRIQVGLKNVAGNAAAKIKELAQREGVEDGVDIVRQQFSFKELESLTSSLSKSALYTKSSLRDLSFGIITSKNVVRIGVPKQVEQLNKEQTRYIERVSKEYAGKVIVESNNGTLTGADDCSAVIQSCSSPLRGGVWLEASTPGACTTGFIVRGLSTGNRYILTAGHCHDGNTGENWYVKEYQGGPWQYRLVGPVNRNELNNGIDAMIILRRTDLSYYMTTEGSIFLQDGTGYEVAGPSRNTHWGIDGYMSNSGLEGQRVCHTGSTTGSSCGKIKEVGLSSVLDETWPVHGLVRTGFCGAPGDSGGPVIRGNYSPHMALGIYTGYTDGSGCNAHHIYTGMSSIMNAFDDTFELVTTY